MGIFSRKTKKEESAKKPEPPPSAPSSEAARASHLADVLRNPRITEKATMHGAMGVYTFDIAESATKRSVSQAIFNTYSVRPRMIRIVLVPRKVRRNMRTGHSGRSRGGKKAYVYLKRGDTITIT